MSGELTKRPHRFMTEDEETLLVARMLAGDRAARDQLIVSLMPLANREAARYAHVSRKEDLRQVAYVGLIRGVDHFDPARAPRVSTYALLWIRQELREYVRANFSVVGFPSSQAAKAEFRRSSRDGSLPFDVALDAPIATGATTARVAHLPDQNATSEDDLAERSEHRARRDALRRALWVLNRRERVIVERRHVTDEDGATLQVLADELGISRERVRQIENEALGKIYQLVRFNIAARAA